MERTIIEKMTPKFYDGKMYRELRCNHCRKFAIWEYVRDGRLLYECPRCHKISVFEISDIRNSTKLPDDKEVKTNG